jgi:hypothetical protein
MLDTLIERTKGLIAAATLAAGPKYNNTDWYQGYFVGKANAYGVMLEALLELQEDQQDNATSDV